jgi:hypothetical protein
MLEIANVNRKWKAFRRTSSWGGEIMNLGQLLLGGHNQLGNDFKTLVDRKIRERRQGERQLAECRTTKHRLEARKSCVADARSYRVASHTFKRWLRAIAQ